MFYLDYLFLSTFHYLTTQSLFYCRPLHVNEPFSAELICMCPCPCPVLTCSFNLRNLDKRRRLIRSASQDGCSVHSFKRWYNLTNPSLWVLKRTTATDIPEIVDFEGHWDILEAKLYDWVKSSLLNIVANLMQSHIYKIHLKIVDGYISSAEFQRSLAERLLLIIFIYYYYFL